MTPETYKALEDSIAHWKRVVADPLGESTGAMSCALCQVQSSGPLCSCIYCPVMQRTGKASCVETPYFKFRDAKAKALHTHSSSSTAADTLKLLSKLAEKELLFLMSLREGTSTDADELIRRLRIPKDSFPSLLTLYQLAVQAADFLEIQQIEIKQLKVQLESNGEEKLYHDEVTKLYSWLDLASTNPLYYAHFHSELYARKALALSKLLNSSQSKLKGD